MYEPLLRDLAVFDGGELPVLTAYLDMRPQDTGGQPQVRAGLVVLKDRLAEIEKSLRPRGPTLDSFLADRARLETFLDHEFSAETHGLAVFACSGGGLFETVEVRTPFDSAVVVGRRPDLFQLARLLDDHENVVVAVVDTSTARIFVTRFGSLEEVGGPDDRNAKRYRKRSMGGLSQMRYQRTIDLNRARFAAEMAAAIDRVVSEETASRLILAGDEVTIPTLMAALSRQTRDVVHDDILRIGIRAPHGEVHEEIAPILTAIEEDASHATAERLIDAVQAGGLGAAGLPPTQEALAEGRVEILVIDDAGDLAEDVRSELVRLAAASGARTEFVQGSDALLALGGVGALLRYRRDYR